MLEPDVEASPEEEGPESPSELAQQMRSLVRDQLAEVLREALAPGDAALAHLGVGRQHDRVEAARDVEPPVLEALVVLDRYPEHLADHDDRERVGELLHQVHLAPALDLVHEPVHDLLDAGHARHAAHEHDLVHVLGIHARVNGGLLLWHALLQNGNERELLAARQHVVVGAGVVGLAIARALALRLPFEFSRQLHRLSQRARKARR